MSSLSFRPVGTVNDAAKLYRTDVAGIWAWITADKFKTLSDGSEVRLSADRKRDSDPWMITAEIKGGS